MSDGGGGVFSPAERMIAWRYLRPKRAEGAISVITLLSFLGILLGVATLIVVMSVMNGFRKDLLDIVVGVSAHVTVSAEHGPMDDYQDLMERLAGIEGVRQVLPQVRRQALVASGKSTRGAVIRGVRPGDLAQREMIADQTYYGSFQAFLDGQGALVGRVVAEDLGARAGQPVTVLRPERSAEGLHMVPRRVSVPVAGIFQSGISTLDDRYIFLPLKTAQSFFDLGDRVTAIEVYGANLAAADSLRPKVEELLGPGYIVRDWRDENASFVNALDVERVVMFIVLALIILVAAFNIIAGQTMQVKAKTRNIAILRTMGTSKGGIMRIFFLAGGMIGLVGTFAGLGLGLLITANLEMIGDLIAYAAGPLGGAAEAAYLSRLPVLRDPVQIAGIVFFALLLTLLAAVYPAWRAARIDPVEALRYE